MQQKQQQQLLDHDGHRAKGRLPNQMRPLLSERGVLSQADGSSKWVQGGSAVLAAVHGPKQAGQRKEDAEKAVIEVLFKPRTGLAGAQEREYEELLRQLLEGVILVSHHPRTLILVIVQVLQADGSLLSVAANAVCAALADAGIPMKSMFAAITCAFGNDNTLIIDPDATEERISSGIVSVTYPCRHTLDTSTPAATDGSSSSGGRHLVVPEDSLLVHSVGRLSVGQLAQALETCRRGAEGVAKFLSLGLMNSYKDAMVKSSDPAV